MWDLGVKSQKLKTLAITILQRCVNQKPRKFLEHWYFRGGRWRCPLVSFPTPLVISIAIVSSIAILFLDTYRGRNFRYRPALCQCQVRCKLERSLNKSSQKLLLFHVPQRWSFGNCWSNSFYGFFLMMNWQCQYTEVQSKNNNKNILSNNILPVLHLSLTAKQGTSRKWHFNLSY